MSLTIMMMLGVSLFLGLCALLGLLWGVRNRQFEDYSKFLDGTKFDSEEALNEAAKMQERRKNAGYRPPD